jgi:sugar/nucleoside kinase (ribokinase family)
MQSVPEPVPADPITVIGNVNVDLIVRPASELPPPGAEWQVEAVEMRAGGAAANSALTLAGLGVESKLVGCVGDDRFGRVVLEDLEAAGISTTEITVLDGSETGVSVAFESPGRERSFLIALGTLARFDRAMIPDDVLGASLVLLCGYFNLPRLRGGPTLSLLEEIRGHEGTTAFDAGWDPDGWTKRSQREVATLLPAVDVFLPNELEAFGLTGSRDAAAAARTLQGISGGRIVVKRGRDGCLAVGPGGEELELEAPRVEVVDTTGAGDAFNAAYLAALGGGERGVGVLSFATRVATTVVSRPSRDRYPTRSELVSE